MIKNCGIGVAVENALDEVKDVALYTAWNNAVRNIPFDKIEPLR